jgi:ribulose 1,5-bisphosphate carboxylase large subunit-like protein
MGNVIKPKLCITAHDVARVVQAIPDIGPMDFLDYIKPDNKVVYPSFLIKGKTYVLEMRDDVEKKIYYKHINNSVSELMEYQKIVEKWNRSFGQRGSFLEFIYFVLKEVEGKK